MNFREFLKNNVVFLDGGMGTLLQEQGLQAGELPEVWNITHPDAIVKIHRDYFDSGSNVVNTNTFGANILKFSSTELDEIVRHAVENAKIARDTSVSDKEKFIALDIGPTGRLLKPFGDFDFEQCIEVFAKTVRLGVKYGVDLIMIETMNDSYETKAALLAAKENSCLPVIVSNAYGEDGKLMTGATPEAMVALAEGMGADAVGANCSLGPKQLGTVVKKLLACASVPVVLKPNAGLPECIDGKTVYNVTAEEFACDVSRYIDDGVRIAGGCCGTTPQYIKALTASSRGKKPSELTDKNLTVVSSYTHALVFGDEPVLIGERINPTGKKRFKQALRENDTDYILAEGISQQEKGVHMLDVNVGLPEIDEPSVLEDVLCRLQAVIDLPLQIDTSDKTAMERALRHYNGKAMINSVNGKRESIDAVFPLVKKYGGVVVALTLDENGIPDTASGRIEIAERILKAAEEYGINKKDIVFDTLCLTVSADGNSANVTLDAMKYIKDKLHCHTSLGISNISFGLPNRDFINSTFFALALENGLDAAIMNPYSFEMMKTYYSYLSLRGLDVGCRRYIEFASEYSVGAIGEKVEVKAEDIQGKSELQNAVVKGLGERAAVLTRKLLENNAALDIISNEIIPALDTVGVGYESKTVYLPQLLMSAEAAKAAFEVIKEKMSGEAVQMKKCKFVIATVRGDIHDIGKNIVKLLLENYGFDVIDLGRDVKPELVVDTVLHENARIVGLSALMTTTVPAMEETIKLLKKHAPQCKTVVGGAVLNEEYARKIGADKYAKDAMETVRYAEAINNTL